MRITLLNRSRIASTHSNTRLSNSLVESLYAFKFLAEVCRQGELWIRVCSLGSCHSLCVCVIYSAFHFSLRLLFHNPSLRVLRPLAPKCALARNVFMLICLFQWKKYVVTEEKKHTVHGRRCAPSVLGQREKKWMSAYAFVAQKTINVTSPYLGITIVDIWFIFKTVNGKIWTRARSLVLCRLVACGRRRPFYTTCELWIFLNSNTPANCDRTR